MSVMNWKYDYADIKPGSSQYDNIDLQNNKCVDAVYRKAIVKVDRGNPFIEALPLPRERKDVIRSYERLIIDYDPEEVKNMSDYQRILSIDQLRLLRYPLPFDIRLETEIYAAIRMSYRMRKFYGDEDVKIDYEIKDEEQETIGVSRGRTDDAVNPGFSLIGYSGCGKSTALGLALDHYPQVIFHHVDGKRIPQIVYLVVSCVSTRTLKGLYEKIGVAIDKAFGNVSKIYENEVKRGKTVEERGGIIQSLIEKFNIGIIIFDEIQLMDFSYTNDSTYSGIMTLQNDTKVAIGAVGTEDAYQKMFPNLQTARRGGSSINASGYCSDINYFSKLMKKLVAYQWYDQPVKFDADMLQTLYDETHGIVDQIVGILISMQLEYFYSKRYDKDGTAKTIKVNAALIKKIAQKYYPGLSKLNRGLVSYETEAKRKKIVDEAKKRQDNLIDELSQKAFAEQIENGTQDTVPLKNVMLGVHTLCDYVSPETEVTDDNILQAYNSVMRIEEDHSDEKKLVKEVFNMVSKMKNGGTASTLTLTVPKKAAEKISNDTIANALKEHEYIPKTS